jgi:hypothetical protein
MFKDSSDMEEEEKRKKTLLKCIRGTGNCSCITIHAQPLPGSAVFAALTKPFSSVSKCQRCIYFINDLLSLL